MADRDREWTAGLPSGQWGRAGACDQEMGSWALQQEGRGREALARAALGRADSKCWDGMRLAGEGEGHGEAGEARRPQQAESRPEPHGDLG